MALGRQLEITIGQGDGISLVTGYASTVVSELDCSFNIVRNIFPVENKCNLNIYNLSKESRVNLLKDGNNLIIKAGYQDEGNMGIIFSGNIDEVITKVDGADVVSQITAISYRGKDKSIESVWVSYAYTKEVPFSTIVGEIANNMGLTPIGLAALSTIKLQNGFNAAGSFRSVLEYVQKIGYVHNIGMYIDGTTLYIFKIGIPTEYSNVVLEYAGSLLSIEETKMGKIAKKKLYAVSEPKKELTVTCLLDPKIIPGEGILINEPDYEGTYIVKEANYYGDNYGGDFNCKLKVESVD